jgi:hypothetical protein
MRLIQQNDTTKPIVFLLVSNQDHISPVTGATPTVQISKNGGEFSEPAGTVSEIGYGWYALQPAQQDVSTLGPLLIHAEADGADPVDVEYQIVAYDPYDVEALGLTRLDAAISSRVATTDTRLDRLDATVSSRLASDDSRLTYLDAAISSRVATTDSRLDRLDVAISSRLASTDSRLNHLDAAISSRLASNDSRLNNLDATISSRLAAASYTPPDNASISAIKAKTDQLQFDSNRVKAKAEVVTDKTGYSLTSEYDRAKNALMYTEYTAPDNTSIAAIKTKTDQLTFSQNKVLAYLTDNVTISMAQTLPTSPADNTVGQALKNAATQLDVTISSRLASNDSRLNNLDATISSRLPTSSYVPPDNTSISAIKAKTDQLQFDSNRVRAKAEVVTDKTGYSLTSEYDRAKNALMHTEYVLPDNTSISAIKSKTDQLEIDAQRRVKAKADQVTDKTGYSLTSDYDRAKNALTVLEYVAPDNASIAAIKTKTDQLQFESNLVRAKTEIVVDKAGYSLTSDYDKAKDALTATEHAPILAGIKEQTDKLQFNEENYVYSITTISGVQVIVQPLAARLIEPVTTGGDIVLWTHSRIRASWYVIADLTGHDLYWIIYDHTVVPPRQVQVIGPEYFSIHGQNDGSSVIIVEAPETLLPPVGTYRWIIRDQTAGIDSVILTGKLTVIDAPDV